MNPQLFIVSYLNVKEEKTRRVIVKATSEHHARDIATPLLTENYGTGWRFETSKPILAFIIDNGHGKTIDVVEPEANTQTEEATAVSA